MEIIGAAALLLWGLRMVRTGVSRAFGARLRHWLALGTRDRVTAFWVGLAATCALQSSTATAVMTASFAGRAMIGTAMALAIMLGADVGTSLVAQVLTFDMHWLSPALIVAGVALFMAKDASRPRAIGRALLGLGLLLLALRLLGEATEPMRDSAVVQSLLTALGQAPALGALVAAVLTVLASSSLAVVLLVLSLAIHGDLPPALAVAMVLGANLGGTVPPLLATAGAGPVARRVPLGNLAMRLAGCLVALPFCGAIAELLMEMTGSPARLVVDAHLAFNLALALVFLPLVGWLAALLGRALPEPADAAVGPRYLDPACLDTPSVALACAARETLRLGDRVQAMLEQSLEAIKSGDARLCASIKATDDEVDNLQQAIKLYLSELARDDDLDEAEARRAAEIVSFAVNLEHVGDVIDRSLRALAAKAIKRQLTFSPEGLAEIEAFYAQTLENLRVAESVFMARDPELARRLVDMKIDVRHFEQDSAEKHLERLRAGRVETLQTSTLHLDILRDLKRINAHIASVAYPILEEIGALKESRIIAKR
jgi:phosphate:Na+ symporter